MNRYRFAAPFFVAAVVVSAAVASAGAISAQETGSLADHPGTGAWMVATPIGPALAVFAADGTVVQGVPATQAGPQGVTFVSAQVGMWEPVDDRTIHFTAPYLLSDANGAFTGTVTVDAHHTVSEDGQTLISDPEHSTITIRDAQNNVIDVIEGGPPAIGTRMTVGDAGFTEMTAPASSPTP
jgi:hypothetical protein